MPKHKMKKVTVKARELTDGDPHFISLVHRPASRIPFRVLKSEDNAHSQETTKMSSILDFLKVTKGDTAPPVASSLISVVVKKEDVAKLLPQLEAQGVKINDPTESGEFIVYKQDDVKEGDELVNILVNDHALAQVTNVKKGMDVSFDDTSFMNNLLTNGTIPSVRIAAEALVGTLWSVKLTANTPDEAKTMASAALKDFSKHVNAMFNNLPVSVFKMDALSIESEVAATIEAIPEMGVVAKAESTVVVPNGTTPIAVTAEVPPTVPVKKAEGEVKEAVVGDLEGIDLKSAEAQPPLKVEVAKGDVKKTDTEVITPKESDDTIKVMLVIKQELLNGLQGIQTSVTSLEKETIKLTERVDGVEQVAKSADKAINGTVLGGQLAPFDESFKGSVSSIIQKGECDVWAGTLNELTK